MRSYPTKMDDGSIVKIHTIGVNHSATGLFFGGVISSYNNEFDNLDKVCVENGIGDIRHCIIGDIKESYEILKKYLETDKPNNLEEYAYCIQKTILDYFGDYSNTQERLSFYPTDEEVLNDNYGKISDLFHKNAAMCVERAMLSQNLLKTLEIDSTFKQSGVIINGNIDAHAYNLIKYEDKCYIFDATIPTLHNNKISPIICEIPQDVYDKIKSPLSGEGISVRINHFNPLQNKDYEIIYDAGRKEIYDATKEDSKVL